MKKKSIVIVGVIVLVVLIVTPLFYFNYREKINQREILEKKINAGAADVQDYLKYAELLSGLSKKNNLKALQYYDEAVEASGKNIRIMLSRLYFCSVYNTNRGECGEYAKEVERVLDETSMKFKVFEYANVAWAYERLRLYKDAKRCLLKALDYIDGEKVYYDGELFVVDEEVKNNFKKRLKKLEERLK